MRWYRLWLAIMTTNFKKKTKATATFSISFRVWITDIDVSVMNHAAILTVFECGRIDAMVRSGFFKLALKKKWYFPSQAISVQFYRPLKIFQKARVFTRISYVDEKWIYIEQKIVRSDKIVAVCLSKNIIKQGRASIPTDEVMRSIEVNTYPTLKYDLIKTYEQECMQLTERLSERWEG